ncbi:MAG TPA: septation protein IspZ [Steroidobacteraceae bacterium]|jgi:intracellular septation protein|nr:septation protein IspZ [Steroidobacteraceae bacterium]
MQVALILLPLAAFLLAYLWAGIYVATGVLMAAMTLLVLVDYLRAGSVSKMHALGTVLVLVFGTATLALRNPLYLQLKSTILFWLLALAFLASQWIGAAPLAQRMLEPAISGGTVIQRAVWLRLNLMWVGAYLLLGLVNLLAVRLASLHAYVYFYVYFKIIGLAIAFALAVGQALWLQRRSVAT